MELTVSLKPSFIFSSFLTKIFIILFSNVSNGSTHFYISDAIDILTERNPDFVRNWKKQEVVAEDSSCLEPVLMNPKHVKIIVIFTISPNTTLVSISNKS